MNVCTLGDTEIEHVGDFNVMRDALLPVPARAYMYAADAVKNYFHPAAPAVKPAGNMNTPTDPVIKYTFDQANKVLAALTAAGVADPARSYGVYQTYHETAAYTNNGAKLYNNYSGIKFAGQKGAKKGPNGYAVFNNIDDWARAFKHEITKGANPAGAKSLEDYAARLKKNGYYEDSVSNYIAGDGSQWSVDPEGAYLESMAGLKRARLVLKEMPAADRASVQADGSAQDQQDNDIPGTIVPKKGFFDSLTPAEKAVGLALVGSLVILTVLSND